MVKQSSEFKWVRSVFGSGEDAAKKYHYIPEGGMNAVLKDWHAKQTPRPIGLASPSTLTRCPRSVWLEKNGVPPTNVMGWGTEQRMLLGRAFEDKFAEQLKDEGNLLYHWKDNPNDVVEKFKLEIGGQTLLEGVPDYLLKLDDTVVISDAKTSRSDSYGYVEIEDPWRDWGWYRYRLQLTAYYMLAMSNKEWFEKQQLPLPEQCHLFSYALDDGIVKREYVWEPTEEDAEKVIEFANRYNDAVKATLPPDCTCMETTGNFEMKFCRYGVKFDSKSKVNSSCCSDNLIEQVKEL